jgi:acyl dehydratase
VSAASSRRSLAFSEVSVGDELPPLEVPLTPTVIISTAIASRDYQDVHHDVELARQRGSKDIFMNILSSNGFVGRFVTDWAGPEAEIRKVSIRLGAPNYPGDCMTLTGVVKSCSQEQGEGVVEVDVVGANQLGHHVSGTVRLVLPQSA